MGRKRLPNNQHLERYVKVRSNGYVVYQHPRMPRSRSFGKDVDAANEVARIVNARLDDTPQAAKEVLRDVEDSFATVLRRFVSERIPQLDWSPAYSKEQQRRINKFIAIAGEKSYNETDVRFFNWLLDQTVKGDGRRTAISLLRHVDKFALGIGIRTNANVCSSILSPPKTTRRRPRISTYKQFLAIKDVADPWLQDAMDIALVTLLPREALCSLNFSMIEGNTLKVLRKKTNTYLQIEIGPSLAPIIQRRRNLAMELGTRQVLFPNSGDSPRQTLTPEYLSHEFTRAVLRTGIYTEESHPTLHEIRSLGARMYHEAGFTEDSIKELMGHKLH